MKENTHTEMLLKYFKGEASILEQEYLLEQLNNEEDWDISMASVWAESSKNINPEIEERILKIIQKECKNKPVKKLYSLKAILNVAVIALFFLLGGSLSYYYLGDTNKSNYTDTKVLVERGQRASLVLPDGTKVQINSDTNISYGESFNTNERRVKLEGEAYFEVKKQPDVPFIVVVGGIEVEALGTQFNIKGYSDENTITTFLTEGKVQIRYQDRTEMLIPGEKFHYNKKTGQIDKGTEVDGEYLIAWRDNVLQFEGQSLEEITTILSRNFNVSFDFSDESIKQHEFTGTVKNNNLNSILQMISLTSPVKHIIRDGRIILSIDPPKKLIK